MSAPVIDRPREATAGPQVTAALDGMEVTQAVQEIGGSIPLVAGKRTFVRAYLGIPTGTLSVRGELRVARKANGPWTTVSSFGTADLDATRSGSTSAQLRGRRENLAYSLDFRLPEKFTRPGSLWFRLGKVQDAGTGQTVQVTGAATRTVTFVRSPRLRLRVINLRYTAQTPPVQFAASKNDLEHLESWLTRAYPVREVEFSSITVNSTNVWPFGAGQANAQVATIRALDVAGGRDAGTHYYGMVSDGGTPAQFMRGLASAIPGTPDPSAVASGPTGSSLFPWDTDGSYGDWYGGHELGHTVGRRHPGFCGQGNDDPTFPFANGQLSNADGAFTGLDVGDSELGIPPAALPGTTWHDVMTYCDNQWLSSYAYVGIRDRLVAEAVLFPDRDDDDEDDDDGAGLRASEVGAMNGAPVHLSAVVNLTNRTADIAYVTPLPGPFPQVAAPMDERLTLRVRMPDGSTRVQPVVFKPDVCPEEGADETGLVDTVAAIDPSAVGLDLLLDGEPIASFEPAGQPAAAENVRINRGGVAGAAIGNGSPTGGSVLTWDDPSVAAAGVAAGGGEAAPRYAVQASTAGGRTWTTLAVGTTDTSLELDPEPFSDAEQVRFRVLTTNGFLQTVTTTEDMSVDTL
jgi:hypothetical protein